MILVSIKRNKNGKIKEFIIDGHSGFDKAGKDIVCASISAISGTAIIGLERVLCIKPLIVVDLERGHLKCSIPKGLKETEYEKTDIILETMVLGIKDISEKYSKFIKVSDKEV